MKLPGLFKTGAIMALALALISAAQAARITEPTNKNVLRHQIVIAGGLLSQDAWVGPLTMGASGYSTQRGATPVRDPVALGAVPVLDYAYSAQTAEMLGYTASTPLLTFTQWYASGRTDSWFEYLQSLPRLPWGSPGCSKTNYFIIWWGMGCIAENGTLDPARMGGLLTEKEAKELAFDYIKDNFPVWRTSTQAWLRAKGVGQAWVSFKQRIQIKTNSGPENRAIIWSAYIGPTGDGVAPDPKLVTDLGAKTLQVTYTPKAADSNVGASAYPDAGVLSWRVVDEAGVPKTGWTSVNTDGAYDEPDPEAVEIDPDHMVKCLVDKSKTGQAWANTAAAGATTVACPQGYPDIGTLLSDNGAQFAVLDYIRRITPVYCREDDSACLNGTPWPPQPTVLPVDDTKEFVPFMYYSYTLRSVTYADCGISAYRNTGTYGGVLSLVTDRYLVMQDGTYQAVNQSTKTEQMAPQAFDWSVRPPSGFNLAADLNGYVVHPGSGDALIPVSAMYEVGTPPAIIETNSPGTGGASVRHTNAAQRKGGSQLNLTLEVSCAINGKFKLGYGWSAGDGAFYGDPVEVTKGIPGPVTHRTYAKNDPALIWDAALYYDGASRLYLQSSANISDGQSYDASSGGWTTAPGLQNNCGAAGVSTEIEGLPYLTCATPIGEENCLSGWHPNLTDPVAGACFRVDPEHQDQFWVDVD